jgi:Ni/Co efflux regulator RcnB
MKRLNTLSALALVVAAALMAPSAFAWDHGHRGHGHHGGYYDGDRDDDRDDRRGYRDDDRDDDRDYRDDRHDDRRDDRRYGRDFVVYRPVPRHYDDYPRWARGARYYDRGYAPTYVVNNYYGYGLRQPPRGYHWRRDDRGDFLLVAIATGIIAEVLFH